MCPDDGAEAVFFGCVGSVGVPEDEDVEEPAGEGAGVIAWDVREDTPGDERGDDGECADGAEWCFVECGGESFGVVVCFAAEFAHGDAVADDGEVGEEVDGGVFERCGFVEASEEGGAVEDFLDEWGHDAHGGEACDHGGPCDGGCGFFEEVMGFGDEGVGEGHHEFGESDPCDDAGDTDGYGEVVEFEVEFGEEFAVAVCDERDDGDL